ncbi:diguanylate cyclase [Mycolicibacterium sp. S2-37]|uniref:sensor domain-containing diguanylate cyclase n=1 Tax=Mycolicibacterium sp. S2-37 TaxID=2810297 RepID=UPI001A94CFB8|nr:diguanylate cyclase [Mycolicibacterium sp. S2-37]MBO0678861.1 diguanylate cyclase [Mycolicibacterium sp. S2-37]
MNPAGQESDEADRLTALAAHAIVDTPPDGAFDDVTALAADVCDCPMALITFVDGERQWHKSRYGIDIDELPRAASFRVHAVTTDAVTEVPDTRLDPRFDRHPLVIGEPHVRFYAGAPLIVPGGHRLGTLCVMDVEPRTLSGRQRRHLRVLADQVVNLLEVRRQAQQISIAMENRLAADAALRRQQRMLEGVLAHTDVLIFAKDVDGRFVMANHALEFVTQSAGLTGRTDHDVFDAEIADEYRNNDRHIMATREWQVFNEDVTHPDGSVHTYRSTKFPLIDDNGDVMGIGGVSTDVTELAATRAAYAEAELRWRTVLEQLPTAVIVVDPSRTITYMNPEAMVLLGARSLADVAPTTALRLIPENVRTDAESMMTDVLAGGGEIRARRGMLRRLDGGVLTVEFNAKAVTHAGVQSVQLEFRDISAVAAAYAELKHSATTDPLTGLLNRRAWDDRIESLMDDARHRSSALTIAVLDFDNFKRYNDTHGHSAGDVLLQRFAAAAAATLRHDDIIARWGGEEFIVALADTPPEQASHVLTRLAQCMPHGQTCSIGYTTRRPAETLTETVVRADTALYQAKREGKNRIRFS